jgi:simple sugar transport system permease protein
VRTLLLRLGAVLAALLLTIPLFAACGVRPGAAWASLFDGAFGSLDKLGYCLASAAPLLLCAAGLLVTFAAGLWNIGVEGQIALGAIAAYAVLREPWTVAHPVAAFILAPVAAALGGAAWALVVAGLKVWGRVHEIFSGLALNFVASGITLHLIMGPWKRPGVASTSGAEPVTEALWLPALPGWNLSAVELLLPVVLLVAAAVFLKGTYFGLRLKALGLNARAAERMGVPVRRNLAVALGVGGALAGLAGWLLIAGASVPHTLHSNMSSGYGYLALLLVLLAGRARWFVPVAVLFAVLVRGGLQLSMDYSVDSSVGGVLQGVLVLTVLLANGLAERWRPKVTEG